MPGIKGRFATDLSRSLTGSMLCITLTLAGCGGHSHEPTVNSPGTPAVPPGSPTAPGPLGLHGRRYGVRIGCGHATHVE
jgi:hypothetical protein